MGAGEVTVRTDPGRLRRPIRVLVVDDDRHHRTLMAHRLGAADMEVGAAAAADEALERLDGAEVVLLDYRMPGATGLELLGTIRARERPPAVVMVTGAGSLEVAVEAMRAGAHNYVPKEPGYLDALPEVVERAWRSRELAERAGELQRLALLVTSASDRDRLFREVVAGAARLLRAESCVLLTFVQGRLEPVTALGPEREDLEDVLMLDVDHTEVREGAYLTEGRLLIPLPSDGPEPLGVLALWTNNRPYSDEEVELGRAFAAFAGIALRNLRRLELERRLVSELQRTLDARRDFVASISHELRTPLTAIKGFADTLREHEGRMPAEQRANLLDVIARNAEELRQLVDELLDLARLERGGSPQTPVEIEILDLRVRVARSVAQLGRILEDRELDIDVPRGLLVLADAALLHRTLGNLLSNAVKFSHAGTPIRIRGRREGGLTRLEVADQGVGIHEWERARIFEPFFRTSLSVSSAVRGSGIGLALVREYVRTMGGDVWVHSEPGQGSTFAVTLPTAPDLG